MPLEQVPFAQLKLIAPHPSVADRELDPPPHATYFSGSPFPQVQVLLLLDILAPNQKRTLSVTVLFSAAFAHKATSVYAAVKSSFESKYASSAF
jgi:hypothetical protein